MAQPSLQPAQIPALEHAGTTTDKKQKEKKGPKAADGSSGYPLEVRVFSEMATLFDS